MTGLDVLHKLLSARTTVGQANCGKGTISHFIVNMDVLIPQQLMSNILIYMFSFEAEMCNDHLKNVCEN